MNTFPPPAPVLKPDSAGTVVNALAKTKMAFANIRLGYGTRWQSIGSLRNHTLVNYYPETRTSDGWVWIEPAHRNGVSGWVSTGVVTFQAVEIVQSNAATRQFPFDDKFAIWHERGDNLDIDSVDQFASQLKQNSPQIDQVWVKVCDWTRETGAQWMGFWDRRRGLAINNFSSLKNWAKTLAAHELELGIWTTPHGIDIQDETALIAKAATCQGVKAVVLHNAHWQAGNQAIAPFMRALRRQLPDEFHIGVAFDAHITDWNVPAFEEWAAFADSLHPRLFCEGRHVDGEMTLAQFYAFYQKSGIVLPVYPVLGADAHALHLREAQTLALYQHHARGLSWWRTGLFSEIERGIANERVQAAQTGFAGQETATSSLFGYGDEIIVKPNDLEYELCDFVGITPVKSFKGAWNWTAHWRPTGRLSANIQVDWQPALKTAGTYEVSAFIPARHSTTQAAKYTIHGTNNGNVYVQVDQSHARNQWVRLGTFAFDPAQADAGVVSLVDFTGEGNKQIAFDAIRWRRVLPFAQLPHADGYDQPVGTLTDRRDDKVWGGEWLDSSPFGKLYFVGTKDEAYHTGADLNLPQNADAHTPVYAAASGIVTFAGRLPHWGNIIIIKHDPLEADGLVLYGRYAHVENVSVIVGQRILRGERIANIGDAFGRWAYLLHFDLSPTTILEHQPGHWVSMEREAVYKHYIDPREFIERNRPKKG